MATLLSNTSLAHDEDEDPRKQPESQDGDVSVPSEMSFAEEVRIERLSILWKATLFGAFILIWISIVISGGERIISTEIVFPAILITTGCLLASWFLGREQLEWAVWSYALGGLTAVALAMSYGGHFSSHYMPFVFPVLIFVVGLLVPARDTLLMLVLVTVLMLVLPSVAAGKLIFGQQMAFALALTTIATAMSAQVSGELFAIAEWALENYRKERRTTFALFESREALQKSFHRQQALTYQLQKTNAELEKARTAAEEAKQFRGQFLANMSHELRTPLNAIIGFSQTILDFPAMYDGVELPPQYRQDMNQILNSGKHLLAIINDILDLSKVDAGKLDLEIQPVDLAPIVKGVLSTAVGLVGDKAEQVELKRSLPETLPTVMGDPLRVRQVLLNMYSNAAKFTDSGHIRLIIREEGDEVVFGVEDTGIGISEADQLTIFEEFRQGTAGRKKGRQGAGLGLAISQQLLRLMDGRLWFESTLGKGSTFYFALPMRDAVAAATPAQTPAAKDDAQTEEHPAAASAKADHAKATDTESTVPAADASK